MYNMNKISSISSHWYDALERTTSRKYFISYVLGHSDMRRRQVAYHFQTMYSQLELDFWTISIVPVY
jgi:hypothetical protein